MLDSLPAWTPCSPDWAQGSRGHQDRQEPFPAGSLAVFPTLPQLPAGVFNALKIKGTMSVSYLEAGF